MIFTMSRVNRKSRSREVISNGGMGIFVIDHAPMKMNM
jgi:hypothetical protein